jgi:hypothetical protein
MKKASNTRSRVWLVLRIVFLLGIIPASGSIGDEVNPQRVIILAAGGLVICLASALWVYFAHDDSYLYNVTALFWLNPLWPFAKFAASVWLFLGMLITVGSAAQALEMLLARRSPASEVIMLLIGAALIGISFSIYKTKRRQMAR